MLTLSIQKTGIWPKIYVPTKKEFELFIKTAFNPELTKKSYQKLELNIRLVNNEEIAQINHQYRQKDKPTNILSFSYPPPPGSPEDILIGDLICAVPKIYQESLDNNKNIKFHWAHLIIHGSLHLMGFDHETDKEAEIMESLEIKFLKSLGYPNPYGYTKQH